MAQLDVRRTALLVMDFQVGILDSFPTGVEDLLAAVARAIEMVRSVGGTVGFVRIAFCDEDYMKASVMVTRIAAAGRLFHDDEPWTRIHPRLVPGPADIIVRKTRVGSFSTTDLDAQLRQNEIDTVILAGVTTSGVVLTTVREAYDKDYRIVVLSDGCFDPDPLIHSALLDQILPRQAEVIDTEQLLCLLRAAG